MIAEDPSSRASQLQSLLAQVQAADNPELALFELVCLQAAQQDAELPALLRACAIPRRFDAQIVGVLRAAPDDAERNSQLLKLICQQRFVLRRHDGGFVYHDTTRDTLLANWRSDEARRERFAELTRLLAEFYEQQHSAADEQDHDLERVAPLIRAANFERYRRLAASIESRLGASLLEALYYRLLSSAEDGFSSFESRFYEQESAGRLLLCQAMTQATRDFFGRLPADQQSPDRLDWLAYFEARVLRQLPPYDVKQAEELLGGLIKRHEPDTKLHTWAMDDLVQMLESQDRLREALERRLQLVALPADDDPYNRPLRPLNLAGLYWQLGELDKAAEYYRLTVELSEGISEARPDMQILARLDLAGTYCDMGRWDQGFAVATEGLVLARTRFMDDSSLQAQVAGRFMELLASYDPPASDAAAEEYLALLGFTPLARLGALNNYTTTLGSNGRTAAAERQLERLALATEQCPDRQHFLADLGITRAFLLERRGHEAQALPIYAEVQELTRDCPRTGWTFALALFKEAMLLVTLGRWQEAEAKLHTAIARCEGCGRAILTAYMRLKLADLIRRRGLLDEAQRCFDEAAPQLLAGANPYLDDVFSIQGDLLRDRGCWEAAQEQYERGLQVCVERHLLSDQIRLLGKLAAVAVERAEWPQAVEYGTRAASCAGLLAGLDQYTPAEHELVACHKNLDGLRLAGALADLADARDLLRDACETAPQNCWYQFNLAFILARLEEWPEAAGALARALELCPAPMRTAHLHRCRRDYLLSCVQTLDGSSDDQVTLKLIEAGLRELATQLPAPDLAELRLSFGDVQLRAGRYAEAAQVYLPPETPAPPDPAAAPLLARAGLATWAAGDPVVALAHLGAAFALAPQAYPFGAVLRPLLRDLGQYWALDTQLSAWLAAPAREPSLGPPLAALRRDLAAYLSSLDAAPAEELLPVVTPVVLEVSDALVPFVDSRQDGGLFLYELIPAMRERIKAETGVTVPGVRCRVNQNFAPEIFELQLDEVPLGSAKLALDRWYGEGPAETLAELAAAGLGEPATHPVTGRAGCWLNDDGRRQFERAGDEALTTPAYLIAYLEAVLRQNLARFVGVQETADLLKEWAKPPGAKEQIEATLPTSAARHRLSWLLQGLLAEGVPIVDGQTILAAVAELDLTTAPLSTLTRAARQRLRPSLPGNTPGAERVALPEAYERQLVGEESGRAMIVADVAERLAFMRWLREELARHGPGAVLVTRSPTLRPLLRRLVAPEFPNLMVLAEEEALDHAALAAPADRPASPQHV